MKLIMFAWCKGTQKQYQTYATKWMQYCTLRHIDFVKANVTEAAEFLTTLFQEGLHYSALNTAQSILSAVMEPTHGITTGNQPLIKRLMKGIFNERPSLPRYTVT